MDHSKPQGYKKYKVTWPGGTVSSFLHSKALNYTEEEIKNFLPMRRNGRIINPVRVKRVK